MNARRLSAIALLAVVLSGCGIRATEVPTDFGAAPSRVPCAVDDRNPSTRPEEGVPVQVFLLCRSSLVAVDRSVRVPDGAADAKRRVIVAQGLLDQLAESPSAGEKDAGYTTSVHGGMSVGGPLPNDPEDTLRLSTDPDQLTSYALAQIVCTFSDSAAAESDGSVILGGRTGQPLRRYACTDDVRSRPGTVRPPSSEVPSS